MSILIFNKGEIKMLEKTVEEIKSMILSHEEKRALACISGNATSEFGTFEAWVVQVEKGRFKVVFDSPVGGITMRSARRKVREFASIDSAMNAVKECGHSVATVVCSQ